MKTIAQNRPQCRLESMHGGKDGIAMLVVGEVEKSKINIVIGEIFTDIINQLFLRDFDLISCKDID